MGKDGRDAAVSSSNECNPLDWATDSSLDRNELAKMLMTHEEPRGSLVRTGPWSFSCDHGCAHAPTAHGLRGSCFGSAEEVPIISREQIVACSFSGIDRADVVVTKLTASSYGTFCEVGYAIARGKPVVFRDLASIDKEQWFMVVASIPLARAATAEIWDALGVDKDQYLAAIATVAPKYLES